MMVLVRMGAKEALVALVKEIGREAIKETSKEHVKTGLSVISERIKSARINYCIKVAEENTPGEE